MRRPTFVRGLPSLTVLIVAMTAMNATGSRAATGEEIIGRARAATETMVDKTMRVSMHIVSPSGEDRARSLKGYEKKSSDGRKILWIFESPVELSGTSFLAHQRAGSTSDLLWVYFPEGRRVRQVPNQLRRERFQGSQFTYEDLTTIFYFDYPAKHTLESEKPCPGTTCFVVESTLDEGKLAYSRLVTWVRGDTFLPERIEFFATEPIKVMKVLKADTIQGIPTILAMQMDEKKDGYRTAVEFTDVHYNTGLADDLFTPGYLASIGK